MNHIDCESLTTFIYELSQATGWNVGLAAMYYALADSAFSAGIKCPH